MANLKHTTISRRTVDRLKTDRDTVFWDSELLGFGVRVYPTGRKVYVVQTRAGGKDGKRVDANAEPRQLAAPEYRVLPSLQRLDVGREIVVRCSPSIPHRSPVRNAELPWPFPV